MSRKIINHKTAFGRFKQIARYYPEIIPIISEGDSWFSYPLAGNNLMDHLVGKFAGAVNYLRLENNGHKATEMFSNCEKGQLKKLAQLVKTHSVPIVLISAGGNDIVGSDLAEILDDVQQADDFERLIESAALIKRFESIKDSYQLMIDCLLKAYADVNIVTHTYDYPSILNSGALLTVNNLGLIAPVINFLTRFGPWIKPFLETKGLTDVKAQQQFSRRLIDEFYQRVLSPLDKQHKQFSVIDLRGTLTQSKENWSDEIHPSNKGFSELAETYWTALKPILLKQSKLRTST